MPIVFDFNAPKAVHAMVFLVQRLRSVDKMVLMKMLYIADREHFLRHGYPITGDRQVAIKLGPLPSSCLNLLDGDIVEDVNAFDYLHLDDIVVTVRQAPKSIDLDPAEQDTLSRVAEVHGGKDKWAFVRETHQFPEYEEYYRDNTSTTIPYDAMLRLYGDESQFRHGRPVVSPAMAKRMKWQFQASPEPTL